MPTIMNQSFARIPAKAVFAGLSKNDWAVLHAICLHADINGRAYPSMARIAEIARIQRCNVPRSIKRIEDRGIMRHVRVRGPNGGWQISHYQVVYEPLGDFSSAETTQVGGDSTEQIENVLSTDNPSSEHISSTDNTRSEHVVNSDNTLPEPVFSHDNTPSEDVLRADTRCSQSGEQGVIWRDALTDRLTDQGTDPYQGKNGCVRGESNSQHVLSPENTCGAHHGQRASAGCSIRPQPAETSSSSPGKPSRRNEHDLILEPSPSCRAYVANEHGHRFCGKPSIQGADRCPEHALRVVA
jgi:helix-turn-helix protein